MTHLHLPCTYALLNLFRAPDPLGHQLILDVQDRYVVHVFPLPLLVLGLLDVDGREMEGSL